MKMTKDEAINRELIREFEASINGEYDAEPKTLQEIIEETLAEKGQGNVITHVWNKTLTQNPGNNPGKEQRK